MLQRRGIPQVTSAGLYRNGNTVPGSLILYWVRLPLPDRSTFFTEDGEEVRKVHPHYNAASDMEDSAAVRAQPQVVGLNQANLQGRRAPLECLQQNGVEGYIQP